MPRIYVDFNALQQAGNSFKDISTKVEGLKGSISSTIRQLDWDVKCQNDIGKTGTALARNLEMYVKSLKSYYTFVNTAYNQYLKLEQYKMGFDTGQKNTFSDVLEKIKNNIPKDVVLTPVEAEVLKNSNELKNVKTIKETLNIMKNLFKNTELGSTFSKLHKLTQITGELISFYKDSSLDANDRAKVIDLGHELSSLLTNKDPEASSADYGFDSSIQNLTATIISSSDGMSNEEAVDFAENLVKTVGRGVEAIFGDDPKARAICAVGIGAYLGGYQIGESIKAYSADGAWDLSDTVNTGIDFFATIVHESITEFTDGVNESAWNLVEIFSNNDNPFDDRSCSEKLADIIKNVGKQN